MENKIKDMISYVFGKYDMRIGEENRIRMENVFNCCMEDLRVYPSLAKSLNTKESLEFFVIQTMIDMLPSEN